MTWPPRMNPRPRIYGPLPKATDVDFAGPVGTPIPKQPLKNVVRLDKPEIIINTSGNPFTGKLPTLPKGTPILNHNETRKVMQLENHDIFHTANGVAIVPRGTDGGSEKA